MKRLTRGIILTHGKKDAYNFLRGCGYSAPKAIYLVWKCRPKSKEVRYGNI